MKTSSINSARAISREVINLAKRAGITRMVPVKKPLEVIPEKLVFFDLPCESLANAAGANDHSIARADTVFHSMDYNPSLRIPPGRQGDDIQQ